MSNINSHADMSNWVLEPDEEDPEDEAMSQAERDAMSYHLVTSRQYNEAYQRGEFPVRVTQLINNEYKTFWTFVDGPAADRYPLVVARHLDGSGFMVEVPDLEGCVVEADSIEKAITLAREAVNAWMEKAVIESLPIPVPSDIRTVRLPRMEKVA